MRNDQSIAELRAARAVLRERRRALPDGGGRRPAHGRSLVLVVVMVIAVVLAGVAVWQYAVAPRHYSDDDFIAAATSRVELLLEADSDDADRAARILSGATGTFHDSFAQSADAYSQYIETAKTRGDGTVDGIALARRDGDSALMLVAASVRVATSTGEDEAPATFRMRVLMTPEDDVLKIAAVEVLA